MDMENGDGVGRERRFEGEDVTPTSERELRGWYSYSMAAEVFAVCGVGSFLPVTLEQLARENGVLYSDRNTPCFSPTVASKLLSIRSTDGRDEDQCLVRAYGIETTTASFAMYTFSAAVLTQALVLISFSSFADHGNNRKRLLLGFGFFGSLTSMLFITIFPSIYLVAPVLVIVAVTCMGSSFVLLNSFLPLLAANHPSLHAINAERGGIGKSANSHISAELRLATKISSTGVGIGYAAAVLVQCLSILVLFAMNKFTDTGSSKTLPLRCVLLLAGLWWFAFTIPAARWLKKRPGPPLTSTRGGKNGVHRVLNYVAAAWLSLWKTIRLAIQLKQVAIFLVAWFLLSDAVATVSGTAILFARTELKMGTVSVALLSITVTASGIAGSVIWPMLSKHFRWKTNRTIVMCMLLMEVIPLYGLIGYLPFVRSLGFLGLQQSWEIFPLGVIFGMVMGGLSSYCRAFFGLLIPPGHEAQFYALFAVTDKGSSAIGPAIVGRIVDLTGHIRPAFIFLTLLIACPIPLVWSVDAERGQHDAEALAKRLTGSSEEIELHATTNEESQGLMRGVD